MTSVTNSPQSLTSIRLEARKSFSLGLWVQDVHGRAADLSGCTLRMVVKREPYSALDTNDSDNLITSDEAVHDDSEMGYVVLNLQASELDLSEGEYPYVVVMVTSEGYSTTLLKGYVEVVGNPEFQSMQDQYSNTTPQTTLEIVLRGMNFVAVRAGHVPPPGMTWLSAADQEKIDLVQEAAVLIPPGGDAGDLLRKSDDGDYLFEWANPQSYDGTLSAESIPAGRAPVSDGNNGWTWGEVSPTVDWALPSSQPGSILNKPILGSAAAQNTSAFAASSHQHNADAVDAGVFNNARVPKVSELRGITVGTAMPSGGSNGDIYLRLVN